ncbi:MAG: NAD-dependent succinate-semialdehyde dehydrogenase [Planctomycetes bacterium]|nr:NAD-dependent succinate-semialdehyde dehydrogenase [Planctomycetota bacterium]
MQSINPATETVVAEYPEISDEELDRRIQAARDAYLSWSQTSFAERRPRMAAAASDLRAHADEYARLMAEEMGKPLGQGRSEVEKCAWVCDYYAENAERFLAPEPVEVGDDKSFVAFRPLGTVLAIMPWNFPMWQVFRFAAPSLMAGNVGLLKHAANVQGSAEAIVDVFQRAGFPSGAFQNLPIGSKRVARVIADSRVHAVTITGSTPAGKAVASAAGAALKKVVLELGGSDPYVILEDCDLDRAVEKCVTSRLINGGQSCIAAKRFIVVESVVDAFTKKFVERMRTKTVGDPLVDTSVDLGPMARVDLRDELHDQVVRSVAAGAKLLLGGEVPDGGGAFYPPTVLGGVTEGMPVYTEETFGPVATIIAARDEEDAIRIANDSIFGLGAAVFTGDPARGERIANEALEAGCCFVNDFVRSDPRLPFGGIKESGYGRELADYGIREFVNIKTVYVGGQA